jgi:hypothetical protein
MWDTCAFIKIVHDKSHFFIYSRHKVIIAIEIVIELLLEYIVIENLIVVLSSVLLVTIYLFLDEFIH